MIVTLTQRVPDTYWWSNQGKVAIETNHIVSMSDHYDSRGGGSPNWAGVRIALVNGEHYIVKESLDEINELWNAAVNPLTAAALKSVEASVVPIPRAEG